MATAEKRGRYLAGRLLVDDLLDLGLGLCDGLGAAGDGHLVRPILRHLDPRA